MVHGVIIKCGCVAFSDENLLLTLCVCDASLPKARK